MSGSTTPDIDTNDIAKFYQTQGASDGTQAGMSPSAHSTAVATGAADPGGVGSYYQTEGGTSPPPALPRSFLDRSWATLKDAADALTPNMDPNAPPSAGKKFAEGVVRGAADVTHPPIAWLARQFGNDEPTQRTEQWRKDFEDKYGDSSIAAAGRVVGQTIGTAPALAAGGVAAQAAARAVPAIAPVVTFLGGGGSAGADAGLVMRLLARAGSTASQGAVQGAAQGALTAGPDQSTLGAAAGGAETGAVLGPVAAAVGKLLGYPVQGVMALRGKLANMVQDDIAPLADRFVNQYGIKLDPSQLTTNPSIRLVTDQLSKLPGAGVGDRIAQGRLQWQRALAGEMGEDASNGITHEVMASARDRIGPGMDAIVNNNVAKADPAFYTDLARHAQELPQYGPTKDQLAPIQAQFQNVMSAVKDGQIDGKAYQNLTQRGGPLDTAIASTDPLVSGFAMKLKDAVDSAFQRSITPEDAAKWQQLRYQYRVMKTVEPLVEQKGLTGDVDPNGLLQRVRAQSSKLDSGNQGLAYTGGGKLGDLAYGGQIFFGRPPDSGTAARSFALHLAEHPVAATVTSPLLAINRGVQSWARSPAVGSNMIANTVNPPIAAPSFVRQFGVPAAVSANLLGLQ
jgi:hypothetical protein